MLFDRSKLGLIERLATKAKRKKYLLKALSLLIERGNFELREPYDYQGLRRAFDALETAPLMAINRNTEGGKIIYTINPIWKDETLRELVDKITKGGASGYKYALYALLVLAKNGVLTAEQAHREIEKICTDENPSLSAIVNSLDLLVLERVCLAENIDGEYNLTDEWLEKLRG